MNLGVPFAEVGCEAIFFPIVDLSTNGHNRVSLFQKIEIVPDKNGDGKNLQISEPDETMSAESACLSLFKMITSPLLKKKIVGVGVPLRISGSNLMREKTYRVFESTEMVIVVG